jgi:hypothetical protein
MEPEIMNFGRNSFVRVKGLAERIEEEPKEPPLSTKENFYDRYIEDKKNGYRDDD